MLSYIRWELDGGGGKENTCNDNLDYSRPSLSADFALFNGNMDKKMPQKGSLVIQGFGIYGIFWERNPRD